MVHLAGLPGRPLRGGAHVPPPSPPDAVPRPAKGPPAPVRRVGRGDRPDVRHRAVRGAGARAAGPQPRPRRPRRREPGGSLGDDQVPPRREDHGRGAGPLARLHASGRRGAAAVQEGCRVAGRGGRGEQRRDREARRGVPARGGGRGGVGEDDPREPVGGDGGDRGGAAGDGGAWPGRRREHGVGVVGGHPLLPPSHHVRRNQTVRCSLLQEPVRGVQRQRHRCAMPCTLLRGDHDAVGLLGNHAPLGAGAHRRRLRPRGGALDRAGRPTLRAQPQAPAPMVPCRRRAGLRPRLVLPAREPADQKDVPWCGVRVHATTRVKSLVGACQRSDREGIKSCLLPNPRTSLFLRFQRARLLILLLILGVCLCAKKQHLQQLDSDVKLSDVPQV